MKVVAIVQARMGSTRLPNKVMKRICGTPMIELLLARLKNSIEIDEIIVATSTNEVNLPLVSHVEGLGYPCEQGSEDNVLNRYYEAAKKFNADVVVRITGDCPLVDAKLVDDCVSRFHLNSADYLSNLEPLSYPDGLDVEVFSFQTLKDANNSAKSNFEKEHVTPYIKNFS